MSDRYQRGLEGLRELGGALGDRLPASLADVAPDFARYIVEFPLGDTYAHPGLDLKTRQTAMIATLTALSYTPEQLKVHIHAALKVGCTRAEIADVFMQMAIYAGFPAAPNGFAAMKDVDTLGVEHQDAERSCQLHGRNRLGQQRSYVRLCHIAFDR